MSIFNLLLSPVSPILTVMDVLSYNVYNSYSLFKIIIGKIKLLINSSDDEVNLFIYHQEKNHPTAAL